MIKGAFILFLLGAPLYAKDSSAAGVAVDSLTGQPLAGVHVRVFAVGTGGVTAVYGAVSDRAGAFAIAKIRPGSYF